MLRVLGGLLLGFLLLQVAPLQAQTVMPEMTVLRALGMEPLDGVEQKAAHPLMPPILANNGRLYGTAYNNPSIYSLPTYPAQYVDVADLKEAFNVWPDSGPQMGLVQDEANYFYGVATPRADSEESAQGILFRLEFDGTHPELISEDLVRPNGALIIKDRILYGLDEGPEGNGRLFAFELDAASPQLETVYTFPTGANGMRQFPNGLMSGSDGWLYGITAYVRGIIGAPGTPSELATPTGTVYRLDPVAPETFEILHVFTLEEGEVPWYGCTEWQEAGATQRYCDHSRSAAALAWPVEGVDGSVYGALSVAFCQARSSSPTPTSWDAVITLPLCTGIDGEYTPPFGHPYQGQPPYYDGPSWYGALWRLNVDQGDFSITHSFSGEDGGQPRGPLVQAPDGFIYGTTQAGGVWSGGTILPGEPVEIPARESMNRFGVLFRFDPLANEDDKRFEVIHRFIDGSDEQGNVRYDGRLPVGLHLGSDGALYGATAGGGEPYKTSFGDIYTRKGTIFRVSLDPEEARSRVTVTITPGEIEEGDTALLQWSTVDASNCTASGGTEGDGWAGPKDDTGYIEVSPEPGTYYYTLTCESTLTGGQVGDVASLGVGAQDRTTDEQTREYGNGGGSPSWWLLAGMGVLLAARSKRSGRR